MTYPLDRSAQVVSAQCVVMMEIELKFQLLPERRRALEQALHAGRSLRRMRLRALYFDTPQCDLAAAGLALRLRREGRVWVQAVKGAGDGPISRLEHEVSRGTAATPPALDLALHDGTPEGQALQAALASAGDNLTLRFETDVWRTRRELRAGRSRVEVALDLGSIRAGTATLPLHEVEFELLAGSVTDLVTVAARWAARHHLWLDTRSKAERGHLLAHGKSASPATKARSPLLQARLDPDAALRCLVRSALQHVLPNASALAAGAAGPEHLHQARVGLRRLRCALRDFGAWSSDIDDNVVAGARQLFGQLSAARDRDALAAGLWPLLEGAGAPTWQLDAGATPSCEPTALFRHAATTQSLLQWIRFAYGRADVLPDAEAPKLEAAVRPHLRRLHRLVRRAGKDFERMDVASRHRTRKRLKRLRYGAEFFAALWPAQAWTAYQRRLRQAQEALGALQDVEAAEPLYREQAEHDPRAWFVVGWLAARRDALIGDAARALRAVGRAPKFLR